jgi:formate hydrogenlyase subunit 3/multisubunit Na+/H+ antiporter MnhD subunit
MVEAILPLLNVPILTPLIIATVLSPLIILAARGLKYPKIVGVYVTAVFAYVLYEALRLVLSGPTFRAAAGQQVLSMISADGITYYFTTIVVGIALASSIYSLAYVKQRVGEFYALLLMMVLGMVGVFFSWDFVTFFVFWELMSITSYLLVAFNYREWEAVESSLKYLVMSSTGSAALLFGLSLLYGLCGTLDFAGLSKLLRSGALTGEVWSTVALVLILGGARREYRACSFPLLATRCPPSGSQPNQRHAVRRGYQDRGLRHGESGDAVLSRRAVWLVNATDASRLADYDYR